MGLRQLELLQLNRADPSPKSQDHEVGRPLVASVKETGCPGAGEEGEMVKSALKTLSAVVGLQTARPASRSRKTFDAAAKDFPRCGKRRIPDGFRKPTFIVVCLVVLNQDI